MLLTYHYLILKYIPVREFARFIKTLRRKRITWITPCKRSAARGRRTLASAGTP